MILQMKLQQHLTNTLYTSFYTANETAAKFEPIHYIILTFIFIENVKRLVLFIVLLWLPKI